MYKITVQTLTGDEHTIYFPGSEEYTITSAVLSLSVGNAGTFEFTVPINNPLYDEIVDHSIITVYEDGHEIWRGDIQDIRQNFDKSLNVYCVEDLAWLGEEAVAMTAITNQTYGQRFSAAIGGYNANQVAKRQFTLGVLTSVTTTNTCNWKPQYEENLLDCLRHYIADDGYVRIRRSYTGNVLTRYVDIVKLSDFGQQATQKIEFGSNLLDFVKEMDNTNFLNVLYPYGAETETALYGDIMQRIEGTPIQNDASVAAFGRRARSVIFETDSVARLNSLALAYLNRYSQPSMKLEVRAVDLGNIEVVNRIHLGDSVRVIATLFGVDQWNYVTNQELDLLDIANNQITLADAIRTHSLTSQVTTQAKEIEETRTPASILDEAKKNAWAIFEGDNGGIVTFDVNGNEQIVGIHIANNLDLNQATKAWGWNIKGLVYLHRDYPSDEWTVGIAMTMNGEIVADYITTGYMSADRINAGTLDASLINVTNLNASNITSGKLSADRIEGGSMSADYIDGGSLFFGTSSKGFIAGCYTWSLSNSFPAISQSNFYNYDVNWVMTGGRFGTFVIVVETTTSSESINATYDVLHTTNGGISWTSVKQDSLIKGWNRIDSKFIISRIDNNDYYRLKITNNGSDSFSGNITLYQAHTIIDEEGVLSRSFKSECADIVISRIQAYSSDYTPSASNMHVVENILFTPNNIGQNNDFEILVQLDTDDTTTGTIGIWVSYWDDYSNGWRLDTNIPYLYPRNVSSFVIDYPNGYSFNGYLFDKDDSTLYQVQIERLRPSISSDVSDIFTVSVKNGRLMELSDTQLCGSFKGSLKGSFNGDINGWIYNDYEDTLKSWGSLVDSDGDKSLAFINYLSKKGFSIGSGEKTANKYGMLSWIPDDGRLILKENFSASSDRGLIVTNYNDKDDPTSYDGGNSKYIIVKPTDIIRDTGSATESVTWDSSSDRRIKKNIVDLDYEMSIEMIDRTKPKRFEFINKDGVYYGMIAQDVRELLDDLGETNSHLEYSQGDLNVKDQRAIDYEEYIPHLINYVKDLRAEISALKNIIKKEEEN